MEEKGFDIDLVVKEGLQMVVDFNLEGVPTLLLDEPVPVGDGKGPNASRVAVAAIANCLSASLLFCLKKSRAEIRGLETSVHASMERSEKGRLRLGDVKVTIRPEIGPEDAAKLERCRGLFEDFCVVTQSVRRGINVEVSVEPKRG